LHFAAAGCAYNLKIVKYLVEKGVDVTIKDSQGKRAIDLALDKDVRDFLETQLPADIESISEAWIDPDLSSLELDIFRD
jgi:hypothetical protein